MDQEERTRRHNERWQKEVLDGMARTLAVLHDISDHLQELAARPLTHSVPTTPTTPTSPILFTVNSLADHLGITPAAVRNLQASGHGPRPTRLGNRIYFHRDDIANWLNEHRTNDDRLRPWNTAHLPGRIGHNIPSTSQPAARSYCTGSNTEPLAASRYTGRAVCRICKDDVIVNKDGLLRKHYPYWR